MGPHMHLGASCQFVVAPRGSFPAGSRFAEPVGTLPNDKAMYMEARADAGAARGTSFNFFDLLPNRR